MLYWECEKWKKWEKNSLTTLQICYILVTFSLTSVCVLGGFALEGLEQLRKKKWFWPCLNRKRRYWQKCSKRKHTGLKWAPSTYVEKLYEDLEWSLTEYKIYLWHIMRTADKFSEWRTGAYNHRDLLAWRKEITLSVFDSFGFHLHYQKSFKRKGGNNCPAILACFSLIENKVVFWLPG